MELLVEAGFTPLKAIRIARQAVVARLSRATLDPYDYEKQANVLVMYQAWRQWR
jgi:hypothetical protein